ncbi:hypothetical protein BKI52_02215 [marine bacterium AO1-C]|nr:hypothetical protein BKI52_02215 [marine bacterium AO1-C]
MNNEIYIIGSGAIGKALAVFLAQEGRPVKLVRGSVDNIPEAIHNITVIGKHDTFQQKIPVTTFSNLSIINGIVLIATKTFANDEIAKKLRKIKGKFSVVLLQNGLNIEQPFKDFDKVYRCVLFSVSQVTGVNEVTFKMVTASPVGNMEGKNDGLDALITQINTPQFEFRIERDIVKYVWNKVIINCAFNSICPLLETDNGIFHRNPEAKRLAKVVIKECVALAKSYHIFLDEAEIENSLALISQKSNGQLISTYRDILNHRQTEIESLNLEIAQLANKTGKPELVSNTKLLGKLIQLKSVTINRKKSFSQIS